MASIFAWISAKLSFSSEKDKIGYICIKYISQNPMEYLWQWHNFSNQKQLNDPYSSKFLDDDNDELGNWILATIFIYRHWFNELKVRNSSSSFQFVLKTTYLEGKITWIQLILLSVRDL